MRKITLALAVLVGAFAGYKFMTSTNNVPNDVKLIPRSVLFGNPQKAVVQLSPDGKYITYVAPLNGVLNVHMVKTDEPEKKPQPLTKDSDRGIRSYSWLHTSKHIAYVLDLAGDENWQVHILNIETGEDKAITPKGAQSSILATSEKFPNEILVAINERNKSFHDVFRVNIDTGEKILVFQNDQEIKLFTFDDDFNLRFGQIYTSEGGRDVMKALPQENGKYNWEHFASINLEDFTTTAILGLDASGKVAYFLDSRGKNMGELKEINLENNSEKVIAKPAKGEIQGLLSHPKTGKIEAYSTYYLKKEWVALTDEMKEDLATISKNTRGEMAVISRTDDNTRWLAADLRDNGPIHYYLYDRTAKKVKFLFHNKPDLSLYDCAKMEGVEIKARDGLVLPSYLTRPLNATEPTPLIVYVHGGPWLRDSWGFDATAQWFANRGYAVLQVNYRGSTGFGKDHVNKSLKQWGKAMHTDLLDAVQWAVDNKIADPEKICIYGGSYGGYAALWGAATSGDAFCCAVDIVGPSNLITLHESIPPYWKAFVEHSSRMVGDHRTEEGKSLLKSISPLTYADQIQIPLLIAQGKNDPRVVMAESEQIVNALKENHIPHSYVLFTDEGHGFAKPNNRLAFQVIAELFLAKHLGGRAEPPHENELTNSSIPKEQISILQQQFDIQE